MKTVLQNVGTCWYGVAKYNISKFRLRAQRQGKKTESCSRNFVTSSRDIFYPWQASKQDKGRFWNGREQPRAVFKGPGGSNDEPLWRWSRDMGASTEYSVPIFSIALFNKGHRSHDPFGLR